MTVEESLRQARTRARDHMVACERASLRWSETAITEMVLAELARDSHVVPFTQPAEARSGADWVWWWVDGHASFGMLVQAKRVTIVNGRWSFDFGYQSGNTGNAQRELLRTTADALGLVPVYALYLGSEDYQLAGTHSSDHLRGTSCARAVSLMPELLASELMMTDISSVYEASIPLEEIATPSERAVPLLNPVRDQLSPALAEFLSTRQDGTYAVARSVIDRVLQSRLGAFSSAATAETMWLGSSDELGYVFTEVPSDRGHFRLPYFPHVLNPLVNAPPTYVLEVLANGADGMRASSTAFPDTIAGVIVTHLPNSYKS